MRILVGGAEIAGTLVDFAAGFEHLGLKVTTAIRERNPLYPHHAYDIDIGYDAPDLIPWPQWVAHSRFPLIRYPRGTMNRLTRFCRLLHLCLAHEVFIFPWGGSSLLPDNEDFRLLRFLGKRVISIFMGSDVRHVRSYSRICSDLDFEPDLVSELNTRSNLVKSLQNTRMAEAYSDVVMSLPNQAQLALRPYHHAFLPVKLSVYEPCVYGREEPLVLIASSSRAVKGTHRVIAALERLKADGVRFRLEILDRAPHLDVVAALSKADVVVDQLYFGLHGRLGIEAMASGCALATCNRQDYEPYPPSRPIWHIESRNLYAQLKRLLTDRELRVRLAHEGRKYVERYHDHVKVARRILDLLDAAATRQHDHYPTYFARNFHLQDGEVVPERLKRITTRVVSKWGLPEDVDAQALITRGLMAPSRRGRLTRIPRWTADLEGRLPADAAPG